MFDCSRVDITMATIVALVNPSGEPAPLEQGKLESVLRQPLTVGQTPTGFLVGSQRGQIEAIVASNRVEVRDLSGLEKEESS